MDIQVTSTELREVTDAATVLVDIQSSGTELREVTDAATVLVDIQVVAPAVGAFPTTGILDSFTRTNSASLGANWIELDGGAQIVSNAAKYDGGMSLWGVAKFTDCEVYSTIGALAQIVYFEWRVALASNRTLDPTVSNNWSGYGAQFDPVANTVDVFKYDGSSSTPIGSTISTTIDLGDSIGISMVGSTIKVYVKPAAGSWAQVGSNLTDSTYTSAGRIAVEFGGSSVTVDEFGGGDAITSAPPDIAQFVDSATVLVDIAATGTELREVTDASTVLVDIQSSGTELAEFVDSAAPYVDLQASGTELREVTDAATVLVDIQTSATELAEFVDSVEVYVDIQATGTDTYVPPTGIDYIDTGTIQVFISVTSTEQREVTDAAEVYVDISTSATDVAVFVDSAEAYYDIQVTSTEARETTDTASVYYDIQVAATELREVTDTGTVTVVISLTSHGYRRLLRHSTGVL